MHKSILNTWKEIAQYVGRSERTLQRWEKELGFPVHRPRGMERSAVLAIPTEVDEWAKQTPISSLSAQAARATPDIEPKGGRVVLWPGPRGKGPEAEVGQESSESKQGHPNQVSQSRKSSKARRIS